MATLRTRCTHCGQGLSLKKPELVGKQVPCPSCRQPFVVRAITSKTAKRKSRPTADDEILEAEVIDAEEVDETSGGDDDWLDALDSLPPAAPVGGTTGEAPPARKSSRKKKSSSGGKRKKRRKLRDADGEFPSWLHRLLMVAAGIVAGIIATVLWAALISASGEPSRYMAILAGVFVGTAVRLGASKWDFGWGPALTSSAIAFISIFAGKIAGFHLLEAQEEAVAEEHNAAYVAMLRHEDYPISEIAQQMEFDQAEASGGFELPSQEWMWEAEERFVDSNGDPNWLEIYNPEYFRERYATYWEAAEQQWSEMPDDEKDARRTAIEEEIAYLESGEQEYYGDLDTNLYGTRIITPWDFFYAIFAIIAAFKIAAGMTDED